jgi:hypothetical protein
MSSSNAFLENLFKLGPEAYRPIYQQITNIYQSDPTSFANVFFDRISEMDPKVVRIICGQLWLNGIPMDQVYAARSNSKPLFLSYLDTFPLESMATLLKYKFPSIIEGDLFLINSLEREGEWLDYTLDVCIFLQIDLNHVNQSTGETCLHQAIRNGSLSLVQQLLRHRVDPNRKSYTGESPLLLSIRSFDFVDTVITLPVHLNIIRSLRRYGANIDDASRDAIQQSTYNSKINQELINASRVKPDYAFQNKSYFSLDRIEDLILLAELDSNIQAQIPNPVIKEAIQLEKDRTVMSNVGLLTWPYFITDTSAEQDQQCYLSMDLRATVAPLPEPELVYEWSLANVPDIADIPINVPLDTNTPAEQVASTEFRPSGPVLALSSGPLLPTDNPALP